MEENNPNEGLPTFIKSWKQLYWLLAGSLITFISILYFITRYFS